jgi:hypothetical protein
MIKNRVEDINEVMYLLNDYKNYLVSVGNECAYSDNMLDKAKNKLDAIITEKNEEIGI